MDSHAAPDKSPHLAASRSVLHRYGLHHCRSQGTPSWLPSICTPGQFFRNQVASAHELICEQYLRPSQRRPASATCAAATAGAGLAIGVAAADAAGAVAVPAGEEQAPFS